jgi:hypothetical protein
MDLRLHHKDRRARLSFVECVAKLDETSSSWREANQGQRRACEDALEKLSQHKRSHDRNESFETQARD